MIHQELSFSTFPFFIKYSCTVTLIFRIKVLLKSEDIVPVCTYT